MRIEQSVLQRLKNKSKSNKISFQLTLQLFCQEEFLRLYLFPSIERS